jgi:ribosome maturation factor RimP
MDNTLHDRIAAIIEPPLANMGYSLVQIRLREGGQRTLQIMAERKDGRNMTVDDCADISHNVSALLDVEDPIPGAYTLEISSPGIDRPLVKLEDFRRFKGFEAKLETKLPIEGRKRFKGKIHGVEGEEISMRTAEGVQARIPFHMVQSAKLVLTDELIDWHGKSAAAAN